MSTVQVSEEDAIHVCMLAMAYLHNAKVGDLTSTSAMRAREMRPYVFYVWNGVHSSVQEDHTASSAPVAECAYMLETDVWKVKLNGGEKLTLRDNGKAWDIVWGEEMLPLDQRQKTPRRSPGRAGRHR